MKIKKAKSVYATGTPPCPVSIAGAIKPRTADEMRHEYNGLLITLAAILEQNNGRVLVTQENIDAVKRQKRVLQLIPGPLALSVQFDTFKEEPVAPPVVAPESNFLASDVAQEAREYLAKQKENHDSN